MNKQHHFSLSSQEKNTLSLDTPQDIEKARYTLGNNATQDQLIELYKQGDSLTRKKIQTIVRLPLQIETPEMKQGKLRIIQAIEEQNFEQESRAIQQSIQFKVLSLLKENEIPNNSMQGI